MYDTLYMLYNMYVCILYIIYIFNKKCFLAWLSPTHCQWHLVAWSLALGFCTFTTPSGHGSLHSNFSLLKHSLTGLSHLKLTTLKSLILSRLSPRSEAPQGRGGRKSVRAEGGGWLQATALFSPRRRKLYTWTHRWWDSIPRPVRAQARQSQWPSSITGKVGGGGGRRPGRNWERWQMW